MQAKSMPERRNTISTEPQIFKTVRMMEAIRSISESVAR